MKLTQSIKIVAIDCCDHILAALSRVPSSKLSALNTKKNAPTAERGYQADLIVIGVAVYPVRRLFISQLRRIYPDGPVLILRREERCRGQGEDCIRGEFLLSDQRYQNDYKIVQAVREILPLSLCSHHHKRQNVDTVRKVVHAITEKYSDPHLDLAYMAKEVLISPKRLSLILNKQVGISFRQLLRQMRIEEAKRLLASHDYSVKEVAARVGFSDSHYFSRSFKELTGQNASDYRWRETFIT